MAVTSLTFEVLDATADDWESLEQVHNAVNKYWQAIEAPVVAEEIMRLFAAGIFEAMPKVPSGSESILAEPTEYWFRMTPAGRAEWQKLAKRFGFETFDGPSPESADAEDHSGE